MKMDEPANLEKVCRLSERCVAHVKQRFGLELDFTTDTLSVLDTFIQTLLKDEGGGETPPPGHSARTQLTQLLAPSVGCYFGEVLRRSFECRWRFLGTAPGTWVIEFERVPLRFNPIQVAAEAFMDEEILGWDGPLATSFDQQDSLQERLEAAPPVPEDEFFFLTTRFEVLQISTEWLEMRRDAVEPKLLDSYAEADYDRLFPSD